MSMGARYLNELPKKPQDVIGRLRPIIIELERQRRSILAPRTELLRIDRSWLQGVLGCVVQV